MANREDERQEILSGTLDLLILKTLESIGPMHGWGIARHIEQVSDDLLFLNQGTLYPALLRLKQRGWLDSQWGQSENNRRAKFYSLTARGRQRIQVEESNWLQMAAIVDRFLTEES